MRWYDYGYLEEIVVRRDDNVLYKFKEGDFPRLNLRDIKDMLLLLVQKKLSNLDVDDRYNLEVALRVLHDIASNLDMDYLPKRHWSNLEMKRSCIMVKAINKLLFERSQNQMNLPSDIPLDSVVVLRSILMDSKATPTKHGRMKKSHICPPDLLLTVLFQEHIKKDVEKVHATHARIVTESVPKSGKKKSGGRIPKSIVIQDTPSAPKSKPATSKTKLKGAPSFTPSRQEAANIMQALKESKKISKRQPGTRGLHEGTGSKPGVFDESTIVFATSSEGTGEKPGVPDEDKDITEEKAILEWGDEQDSDHSDDDNDDAEKDEKDGDVDDEGNDHVSDKQDDDDEDDETKSDEDDIYKYKIRMRKDEDKETKDDEVEGSDKGDEEITNAAKEKAKKNSKAKDDTKNTELPSLSSSLSVSSGFGDQFLKLSFDSSLVSTDKDYAYADVSSLLDVPIQHETPQIQSLSVQKILILVILDTINLPPIPEIVTKTPVTIAALEEYNLKSALYQFMDANKSFKKNPAKHRLYHALMETLIKDENSMDKGVADTVKDHKRKHGDDEDNDDEDPPVGPNQGKKTKRRRTKESQSSKKLSTTKETPKGKAPTKGSKTGKSASAKEPVEEPIAEVIMDDAGDDLVRDDDQPQAASKPKNSKTLNPEWFKQHSRPPTPDLEWNKHQLYMINSHSLGSIKWSLLQRIL
nr:hypothetical protein [Tanacetum cinerariifolium]